MEIRFLTNYKAYIKQQIKDLIEEDKRYWTYPIKIIDKIFPLFSIISYYHFKKRVYKRHINFALIGKYEMGYSQPAIKSIGINLMIHKSGNQRKIIDMISNTIEHETLHCVIYDVLGEHIRSKENYDGEETIIEKMGRYAK